MEEENYQRIKQRQYKKQSLEAKIYIIKRNQIFI
jgi:hypothetical protein